MRIRLACIAKRNRPQLSIIFDLKNKIGMKVDGKIVATSGGHPLMPLPISQGPVSPVIRQKAASHLAQATVNGNLQRIDDL
jgi:hypothetical protein